MINCHVSVCDIYFRCTNLFVHFVAIYIPLCAIADDRTCHAPISGPTRLVDPNRVRGARLRTGTLYLIFFF